MHNNVPVGSGSATPRQERTNQDDVYVIAPRSMWPDETSPAVDRAWLIANVHGAREYLRSARWQ